MAEIETAGAAARHRPRAVAKLDPVDACRRPCQSRAANANAPGLERRTRANPHLIGGGVLLEHVERLARRRDAEPAALTHGEAMLARVTAHDVARQIGEGPPRGAGAP